MSLQKQDTQVLLDGTTIKGSLIIGDGIWCFKSGDPLFLSHFPSGSAFSFDCFEPTPPQTELRMAMTQKVEAYIGTATH